jgi:hypothetical protein
MASRRPKTRVGISTEDSSSKKRTGSTRRTKVPEKAASRGRKKPQKQNNSALFIGLGVGAFLLLIIIVAAANSGGGSSSSGRGDNYMSISQKKSIYAEYVSQCKKIERETSEALAGMDADTKRRARSGLGKRSSNLKEAFKNRLQGRFEKKIKNLPGNYIAQKVIAYGKSNGW